MTCNIPVNDTQSCQFSATSACLSLGNITILKNVFFFASRGLQVERTVNTITSWYHNVHYSQSDHRYASCLSRIGFQYCCMTRLRREHCLLKFPPPYQTNGFSHSESKQA